MTSGIEKVIKALRARVADMQTRGQDMELDKVVECEGLVPAIQMSGNYARALLTEIDYWRARCKAAEAFTEAVYEADSLFAGNAQYGEWQCAVDGEGDKARYLETLHATPVE